MFVQKVSSVRELFLDKMLVSMFIRIKTTMVVLNTMYVLQELLS
jgi:hypothetical protein